MFCKNIYAKKLLTIFVKLSILDFWQSFEYASKPVN